MIIIYMFMIFIVFIMKYIQKNKTADEWHFTPFIGVSRSSKLKTQSQKQISFIIAMLPFRTA